MKSNTAFSSTGAPKALLVKHRVWVFCAQSYYIPKYQKIWANYDVCIYVLGVTEQNYKREGFYLFWDHTCKCWGSGPSQGDSTKGGTLRKRPDRAQNWGWFPALTNYDGEHRPVFHGHQLCAECQTQQALCIHYAALWTQKRQGLFAPTFKYGNHLKKWLRDFSKIRQPILEGLPIPNSAPPCCLQPTETTSRYGLSVNIK